MSKMYMAIDIPQRAQRPLHISEIIPQVKTKYGVTLDRESLVSALVKKGFPFYAEPNAESWFTFKGRLKGNPWAVLRLNEDNSFVTLSSIGSSPSQDAPPLISW
jgi:hypothetical protein